MQSVVLGIVFTAQGGLPLRLQYVESRSTQAHIGGNRTQPGPLRIFARRCRATLTRLECASRRKQSRSHAPHLQGRAGDLRLFGEGARRTGCGLDAERLLSIGRERRHWQRPRQRRLALSFCRQLDGRCERLERFGPARRRSARRVPVLRRRPAGGAEGRLHPSADGARDGRGPHVPRPHREIYGISGRDRAPLACRCQRARRHRP